jgi:hypothetical protein
MYNSTSNQFTGLARRSPLPILLALSGAINQRQFGETTPQVLTQ